MNLRTRKVFASTARSRASQHNEGFKNPTRSLRPLFSSIATFRNAATTSLHGQQSVIDSHCRNRRASVNMTAFASRCFSRTIKIPDFFRNEPLESLARSRRISARLAHALHTSRVRVLGDLHGRRGGMAFAVPKSVRRLRFDELPITKRLTNVVRSNGATDPG